MQARARATWDDLLRVPEHLVAEIVDGELVTSPRPRPSHAHVASGLGHFVGGPFHFGDGPGGWWILVEPELHLGADILVPDLAGWRRARLPILPDDPGIGVAPDWVCEILSPSTHRHDRFRKMPAYHAAGVAWAWLIDPALRTLEVYRNDPDGWLLKSTFADVEIVRAEPFDAIELPMGRWWLPTGEGPAPG
jgi:Uma2 family endonuclease